MSLATLESKIASVMEKIGKDFAIGLAEVEKYLPEVATLASLIFPQDAAPIAATVNTVGLIQNAVAVIEQKYAATGAATGTGAQKLADVLTIVTPTVTQLLATEGLNINQTQITGIVNAVVAILNAQVSIAPAEPVAPAANAADVLTANAAGA